MIWIKWKWTNSMLSHFFNSNFLYLVPNYISSFETFQEFDMTKHNFLSLSQFFGVETLPFHQCWYYFISKEAEVQSSVVSCPPAVSFSHNFIYEQYFLFIASWLYITAHIKSSKLSLTCLVYWWPCFIGILLNLFLTFLVEAQCGLSECKLIESGVNRMLVAGHDDGGQPVREEPELFVAKLNSEINRKVSRYLR